MSRAQLVAVTLTESDVDDFLERTADEISQEAKAGEINRDTIRDIGHGTTLYHRFFINADGSPVRARVTGKVRTWVRNPGYFEIPWKHGMRTHGKVTPDDAGDWTTVEPAGVDKATLRKRRALLGKRWDDLRVKLPVQEAEDPVKDQLMGDDALLRMVTTTGDAREYVEGYMVDYLGTNLVTPENVAKVMANLPEPNTEGFPDVFAVFAAVEAAGLGNAAELERQFFAEGGD